MMVIFLCGVVALILMRTLRNDYIKYSNEEEELELESVMDETGWKMVHSEVFRRPQHLMLYAALIGTGYQLFVLALLVITVTLMFSFYDEYVTIPYHIIHAFVSVLYLACLSYNSRGSVGSTLIACYALTTFVAGYTSGAFYKRNEGRDWKICMILTVVLFPGFCGIIIVLLNFIAIAYESNTAIGAYTLV
jgi:transmembrane 9 superfamily protein 3